MLRKILGLILMPLILQAQYNFRRPIFVSVSGLTVIARGSGTNDTAGTTLSTSAMNCTGANLIITAAAGSSDVASSFDDNLQSGYTLGTDVTNGSGDHLKMAYKQNAAVSGAVVVTVTYNSSSTFRRVLALCVANASISATLDSTMFTANGTVSPATITAITPSVTNGLLFAVAANNDGGATWTANNSFSLSFATPSDFNSIERNNGTGSITPSVSMTSTGGSWRMTGAAFK